MKHRHRMPFGAEILDDAAVRFRLWAPRAQNLAVEVDSKGLPMRALDDGWFELTTREAGPGTRYQFTVDRRYKVPDPASRYQPSGLHGPSEVPRLCARLLKDELPLSPGCDVWVLESGQAISVPFGGLRS